MGSRLDRRTASINRALGSLRWGELLYLEYRAGKPHWSLSGGSIVTPDIAALLIRNASVVPLNDALLEGMSQTWRFAP